MGKTSYKREAARIRQRERRRKKAEQERSSSPQDAELTTTNKAPSEDEADTFAAAFLLYIFFDKKGHKRPIKGLCVPPSCRRSFKLATLYTSLLVYESPPLKFSEKNWYPNEILRHLKDLQTQFSNMCYRQLFTGVHSVLSALSSSDLRSIPSSNHLSDLLQHIQTTLPILIDKFRDMTKTQGPVEYREALPLN